LADENRKIVWEKVKGKFSTKFEIFFGNRGKSETGRKCTIASEGWTPLYTDALSF